MPRPPRFGDAPRAGPPPASAEEVARLMRRAGVAAALLVAWALGSLVAVTAAGRVDGPGIAFAGAVPTALVAVVLLALDLRSPSRGLSVAASAFATLALALAIGAHALFWGGLSMRAMLPGSFGWIARAGVLLVVPLYAGARLKALELAWNASGSCARSPLLTLEAIARPDDAELLGRPAWSVAWRGALARWSEGLALPGLLLLDAALVTARPTDRLHAQCSLDEVADALASHGASVERGARELRVRFAEGAPLRLAQARILLPPGTALDVRGPVDEARRLRRLLESAASHALVFSWSAPARRWEHRLNALHREARVASSLEERSVVMEELDLVRRALDERALCGEEYVILALKEESVRAMLAHRMLSEPPSPPTQARIVAPHGALLPDVARVLDAGGLASVKRIAFVPHWILPVRSPWGEQEVVVSASTGRIDPRESRALLGQMRERGPSILLEVGPQAVFLPAPPPTAALLRELRAAGLAVTSDAAAGEMAADVVYVPYLATAAGYVSGITGSLAADLGNGVPVVPVGA